MILGKERKRVNPIIFLGDSITEAFPFEILLKDFHILNKGVSGDTTELVLARIDEDVIRLKPSAVFLLVGINDIASYFSNDELLISYEKILFRLTHQLEHARIFIQSILPTRNLENLPTERIELLNLELQKIALRYGVEYLDLYPHFLDTSGALAEEFSDDGLHLTEAGYKQWSRYLIPVLKTLQ